MKIPTRQQFQEALDYYKCTVTYDTLQNGCTAATGSASGSGSGSGSGSTTGSGSGDGSLATGDGSTGATGDGSTGTGGRRLLDHHDKALRRSLLSTDGSLSGSDSGDGGGSGGGGGGGGDGTGVCPGDCWPYVGIVEQLQNATKAEVDLADIDGDGLDASEAYVLWNYLTSFKRPAGSDHVWLKLALAAMDNVPTAGAEVAFSTKTCEEAKDNHTQDEAHPYPACFKEYKDIMVAIHFTLGSKLDPEMGSELSEMTSAELDHVIDGFMYLLADADKDDKMSLLESYISGLFRSAPPLSQAHPCPFSVFRFLSA